MMEREELSMSEPARRLVSYADYLAAEERSGAKHEWLDGEVFAMSGSKPVNALLAMRVGHALTIALGPRGCDVYSSDLRVRVPASGLATYPDVGVVCGEVVPDLVDPDAATNPSLLVEVLSRSTERWDRGGKMRHYQRLPSLTTYVLVHTRERRVEWYTRLDDGSWRYQAAGPGEVARLAEGVALVIDELYARTAIPGWDLPPRSVGEDDDEPMLTA